VLSSRYIGVKRGCAVVVLALAGLAVAASPTLARKAYVADSGDGTVAVIDTGTNAVVGTIAVGGEPVDVAISPNGTRAYVADEGTGTVAVIDTANNSQVGAIPVGLAPRGIAVSPDGHRVYVSNSGDDTVSVIDTGLNAAVGAPIPVGEEPEGVAISPDGTRAFVAQRGGNVSVIDTSTNAVVNSVPDALGPARIAIGPRGSRAFVTNGESSSVTAFNPVSGSVVGAPIAVGSEPAGIAIEPSGRLAYVASPADGTVTAIDTALESPLGAPIGGFPGATGVAIDPRGLQGYVTNGAAGASVSILDTTRNVAAGAIPVGSAPAGVAVVPNQGPVASFFVSPPTQRRAKKSLTFHAAGSQDPDGKIANYAWNFGDRGHAEGSAPTRVHRYRKPGTYLVTLTVTDGEGCSTGLVYTGQTASCNGSPAAVTSSEITVIDTRGPILRLAGAKRQPLRGRVNVLARCPREACALSARGVVLTTIKQGGGAHIRKRRLGSVSRPGLVFGWRKLALRVPGRTRRATLAALRRGGKAVAWVTVVASDATDDRTLARRKVTLVLPRH
jgi:YVTN family beta-propeller protein